MKKRVICHQQGKDHLYKTWHASKEHLFIYFYSDGGNIVCGEKVFPIKKNALAFIAADVYHYTMPEDPEKYDRSKLQILPEELNRVLGLLGKDSRFKNFNRESVIYSEIGEKDQKTIDGIFEEFAECDTDDERELILMSCCMKLLFYLYKYSKESTRAATGVMGKAVDYINKNISTDINLDEVCAAVGVSKYHFCRQFKKATTLTTMQYILKTRIALAKSELRKSDLSITEISEKFGFCSVSYFCRVFKETEECSPLQYRKKNHS